MRKEAPALAGLGSARDVLFLYTHNSARSQMAEGMLLAWGGDRFEAHSAGTEATSVRPEAILVMSELGIDIGAQASKAVARYSGQDFDLAVAVREDAKEACPYFPARRSCVGPSRTRRRARLATRSGWPRSATCETRSPPVCARSLSPISPGRHRLASIPDYDPTVCRGHQPGPVPWQRDGGGEL